MATAVKPKKSKAAGSGRPTTPAPLPAAAIGGLHTIDVRDIDPSPYQPRRDWVSPEAQADLQALADDITRNGLLQPVVVHRVGGRFELIAGERRWRASTLAGRQEIPALVRQFVTDDQAATLALVENLKRRDLSPLEEAEAYHRLIKEQGWTQQQVAERLGVPRSTVGDRVRVLSLPEPWLALIRDGAVVQLSHAPALLPYAPAPAAVHTAAVKRLQDSSWWRDAVDKGRPVEIDAMPSAAWTAYSLDLWDLERAGELQGEYEGPVVTIATFRGEKARRFAADPAIWLPMRQAFQKAEQERLRSPRSTAPARVSEIGHAPARTLRDDVVLQLPDGHAASVVRGRTQVSAPVGIRYLTDTEGRWEPECDPTDLALDASELCEVQDLYFGARRVATTNGAAVDAAEQAWDARWEARKQALRAEQGAPDYTVRGPGVRFVLRDAVEYEPDRVATVVRDGAAGVVLPNDVQAEVTDGACEEVTAPWLAAQPLEVAEAVATAYLRNLAEDKCMGRDEVAQQVARERAAALAAIARRPVPWVVERPKQLSGDNRGLFDEEAAAGEGDDQDDHAQAAHA